MKKATSLRLPLWFALLGGAALLLLSGLMFRQEQPVKPKAVKPPAATGQAQSIQTPAPRSGPEAVSPIKTEESEKVQPPKTVRLWAEVEQTSGSKLDPKSAAFIQAKLAGKTVKGRTAVLSPQSFSALKELHPGDTLVIPLFNGEKVSGVVNLVQPDEGGWVRVGGHLTDGTTGTFSLGQQGQKFGGVLQFPQQEVAIEIETQSGGQTVLVEKLLSEVICFPMPAAPGDPAANPSVAEAALPAVLSSRPTATAVLYLDFDGATVTDNSWNGGSTIFAQSPGLNNTEITEVWNRVKEDYWPFNVDVTTDANRYANAPVGRRMRCIITPTKAWYGNVGGIAYRNSFAQAGGANFSTTIPCWVLTPL